MPPPLRYPDDVMLTLSDQVSPEVEIFDAAAVAAELERLTHVHADNERELRLAVSRQLRAALARGRAAVERLLIADRHGRRCAERLSLLQDEIIRLLFEFAIKHLYPAQNPSEAERMAIVATGGYGRGVLAAGSDIDLLFLLPYKQTAWGESVAETILYCLWDMGLKVGHATRSVNECIRQAKADMTIRTSLLEARYLLGDRKLFDELVARFDKEVCRAPRRNSSPPSSPSARSATGAPASPAIWSSPTSRTAKAGNATCTRSTGSPNTSIACASARSSSRTASTTRANTAASAAAAISSARGAVTCTSSRGGRRSGCLSTFSARSRCGSATPSIRACARSSAS